MESPARHRRRGAALGAHHDTGAQHYFLYMRKDRKYESRWRSPSRRLHNMFWCLASGATRCALTRPDVRLSTSSSGGRWRWAAAIPFIEGVSACCTSIRSTSGSTHHHPQREHRPVDWTMSPGEHVICTASCCARPPLGPRRASSRTLRLRPAGAVRHRHSGRRVRGASPVLRGHHVARPMDKWFRRFMIATR